MNIKDARTRLKEAGPYLLSNGAQIVLGNIISAMYRRTDPEKSVERYTEVRNVNGMFKGLSVTDRQQERLLRELRGKGRESHGKKVPIPSPEFLKEWKRSGGSAKFTLTLEPLTKWEPTSKDESESADKATQKHAAYMRMKRAEKRNATERALALAAAVTATTGITSADEWTRQERKGKFDSITEVLQLTTQETR
jgi:hypothetical protein